MPDATSTKYIIESIFIHFLDSYYAWNVLRKEVNTLQNESGEDNNYRSGEDVMDFNLDITESREYLTKLSIRNLAVNPIYPCSKKGMELYDCFSLEKYSNKSSRVHKLDSLVLF